MADTHNPPYPRNRHEYHRRRGVERTMRRDEDYENTVREYNARVDAIIAANGGVNPIGGPNIINPSGVSRVSQADIDKRFEDLKRWENKVGITQPAATQPPAGAPPPATTPPPAGAPAPTATPPHPLLVGDPSAYALTPGAPQIPGATPGVVPPNPLATTPAPTPVPAPVSEEVPPPTGSPPPTPAGTPPPPPTGSPIPTPAEETAPAGPPAMEGTPPTIPEQPPTAEEAEPPGRPLWFDYDEPAPQWIGHQKRPTPAPAAAQPPAVETPPAAVETPADTEPYVPSWEKAGSKIQKDGGGFYTIMESESGPRKAYFNPSADILGEMKHGKNWTTVDSKAYPDATDEKAKEMGLPDALAVQRRILLGGNIPEKQEPTGLREGEQIRDIAIQDAIPNREILSAKTYRDALSQTEGGYVPGQVVGTVRKANDFEQAGFEAAKTVKAEMLKDEKYGYRPGYGFATPEQEAAYLKDSTEAAKIARAKANDEAFAKGEHVAGDAVNLSNVPTFTGFPAQAEHQGEVQEVTVQGPGYMGERDPENKLIGLPQTMGTYDPNTNIASTKGRYSDARSAAHKSVGRNTVPSVAAQQAALTEEGTHAVQYHQPGAQEQWRKVSPEEVTQFISENPAYANFPREALQKEVVAKRDTSGSMRGINPNPEQRFDLTRLPPTGTGEPTPTGPVDKLTLQPPGQQIPKGNYTVNGEAVQGVASDINLAQPGSGVTGFTSNTPTPTPTPTYSDPYGLVRAPGTDRKDRPPDGFNTPASLSPTADTPTNGTGPMQSDAQPFQPPPPQPNVPTPAMESAGAGTRKAVDATGRGLKWAGTVGEGFLHGFGEGAMVAPRYWSDRTKEFFRGFNNGQ